jgi:hypothetical protein
VFPFPGRLDNCSGKKIETDFCLLNARKSAKMTPDMLSPFMERGGTSEQREAEVQERTGEGIRRQMARRQDRYRTGVEPPGKRGNSLSGPDGVASFSTGDAQKPDKIRLEAQGPLLLKLHCGREKVLTGAEKKKKIARRPNMPLFNHGYALLIGVGSNGLPMTITDAEGLASVLRDRSRCAYPNKQVKLLTKSNATRAKILNELDRLAKNCQRDSEATVIIYYSGHGGKRDDSNTYFLVPYDCNEDNFEEKGITATVFGEKLEAIHAARLLVILDCCHAGGLTRVKGQEGKTAPHFIKEPIPARIIELFKLGSGRVAIASCKKEELSYPGEPYSVFTAALLEALAGYGARTKSGVVELTDVIWWLGQQVPDRTEHKQNPILDIVQGTAKYPLAYYAGGEKEIKRFEWSTTAPAAELEQLESPEVRMDTTEYVNILRQSLPSHFDLIVGKMRSKGLQPSDLSGGQSQQAEQLVRWVEINQCLVDLHKAINNLNPGVFAKKKITPLNVVDRNHGRHKSVWKLLGFFGVVVCIISLVCAGYFLFRGMPIGQSKEKVIQDLDYTRDEAQKAVSSSFSRESLHVSVAILKNGLKKNESVISSTSEREIIYRAAYLYYLLECLYYQDWKFTEACLANEKGFALFNKLYKDYDDPLWRPDHAAAKLLPVDQPTWLWSPALDEEWNPAQAALNPLRDEDAVWFWSPASAVSSNRARWAVLVHAREDGRLDDHTRNQVNDALDYGVEAMEKIKGSDIASSSELLRFALHYYCNGNLDRMEEKLRKADRLKGKERPPIAEEEARRIVKIYYYFILSLLQAEQRKCEEALTSIKQVKNLIQKLPDPYGWYGYVYLLIARATNSPAILETTLKQARDQLNSGDRCESCKYNLACVLAKMSETADETTRKEFLRRATELLLYVINRAKDAPFELEVSAIKNDPFLKSVVRQEHVIWVLDCYKWNPKDGRFFPQTIHYWKAGIPFKCIRFTRLAGDNRKF